MTRFFLLHDITLLTTGIVALCFYLFANLLHNPYNTQNRLCHKCCKLLSQKKVNYTLLEKLTNKFCKVEWRAFCVMNKQKAWQLFIFEKRKHKTLFNLLYIADLLLFGFYLINGAKQEYLVAFVTFLLFSVICFMLVALHKSTCESYAHRTYNTFVAKLDGYFSANNGTKLANDLEHILPTDKLSLQKAIERLHQNGLEAHRSADEQKRINIALNNLMQSYVNSCNKIH